jgi:hypothetical protein
MSSSMKRVGLIHFTTSKPILLYFAFFYPLMVEIPITFGLGDSKNEIAYQL